jgi:hypothetical protein
MLQSFQAAWPVVNKPFITERYFEYCFFRKAFQAVFYVVELQKTKEATD